MEVNKLARAWPWIVFLALTLLILLGAFTYFLLPPPGSAERIDFTNIKTIDSQSVSLILQAIGVGSLHSNPLTGSSPILCMIVDTSSYKAVVDSGIRVTEANCSSPDLTIVTSSQELLSAMASPNIKLSLKDSLQKGRSQLVVGSSQADLAAKGYLSLYNSLK